MNPAALPVPARLHADMMEVPYSMNEKILLMSDLLDHWPAYPKGLRYAEDFVLRHPVSMKFALLWSAQSDGIHW